MSIEGIRSNNYTQPMNTPTTAKPQEKCGECPQQEPSDHITLGGVASKVGKFALGTGLSVVMAPMNAVIKGAEKSSDSALTASGLGHFGTDNSILKDLGRSVIYASPALGMVAGLAVGAGPVGVMLAGFALPGAIAGAGSAISGGIDGAGKGLDVAFKAGEKVGEKVEGKLGKIAGKIADFTTSVALGAVALPVGFVMGSVNKGLEFAEKAIGVNKEPKTTGEAVGSLVKEGAVLYGGISGALGGSGVVGVGMGVGSGAGSMATMIKGGSSAIEGFLEGIETSFDLADQAIDKLTKK